ncbi:hypothetical protein [Streptomyces sp. NPDC058086]|uniref:hypothetical protein n=1 Tax=Streptomyces sp. NPDC058086 TaxID=3346334 RepID=UPI0036E3D8CE
MNTMRAVRAHRRGGSEQLVHETAPRPGPGDTAVAVRAASITTGEFAWDATWTDSSDGSGRERTPVIAAHAVFFVVEPDRDAPDSIQTPAAYEALEKEHRCGKAVIHVADG